MAIGASPYQLLKAECRRKVLFALLPAVNYQALGCEEGGMHNYRITPSILESIVSQ